MTTILLYLLSGTCYQRAIRCFVEVFKTSPLAIDNQSSVYFFSRLILGEAVVDKRKFWIDGIAWFFCGSFFICLLYLRKRLGEL